ncbi:MAG TPA: rod shape-determining protein RodA, partial [Chitinispirillaceae bacterium]|nr:rod shape-determining protein RodA [Chitinispirillaceae bacterium]
MKDLAKKIRFDFSFFFAALALWIIGFFLVYSATVIHESGPLAGLYKQQIIWILMALLVVMAIVSVPGRFFYGFAYVFYGLSIVLLLMALFMGVSTKGAERWIMIAGFKLQPSEFAKIGLLLALARYLSERKVSLEKISSFIIPGLLIGVPFLLVMKQPDLGTAGVFCAMALPMFFWGGLSTLEVAYIVSPILSLVLSAVPLILSFGSEHGWGIVGAIPWGVFFVALCGLLYFTRPSMFVMIGVVIANLFTATMITIVWGSFLKDYQKMRVISFINPQADPFGAGYQVIQSKVAIGSGGVMGKGFLQGTQTKLSFLPEQHTDFIFSVLGEQFGFIGSTIVILLFMFLIVRGYMITQSVRNRFFNLVIIGAISIIAFHAFVNSSMTLGMMPVTGIPLPFLSYGGSFALTVAMLVGIVLNTKM